MPVRINHLAVIVAALAHFFWRGIWYSFFGTSWAEFLGEAPVRSLPMPAIYAAVFVLGLILAYATAIALALARHPEDQPGRRGLS